MMKNIIFYTAVIFLCLPFTIAQADSTTPIKNSYYGDVISEYIPEQLSGAFNLEVWIKFTDSTKITATPVVNLPDGWSSSFTDIKNNEYFVGDSITWNLSITYPINDLPFYPQEISISFYANERFTPGDTANAIYNKLHTTAMVYFTPYNRIEVWSLTDFQNLYREWNYYEDDPGAQRSFIDSVDIPESNIDNYTIDWNSDNWDDDWRDDFREIKMDGLAYTILMKPVPPDSIDYYSEIADGADSLSTRKTFTGRVTGYLMAEYHNSFGDLITFPLTGIQVILKERDLGINETFAKGYTNADGYFDLFYSESQSVFEGTNVELFLNFRSKTSNQYDIHSTDFWGFHYNDKTEEWSAPANGGTMNQGNIIMVGDGKHYYDAFRAVHWGNKGYEYFDNSGTPLGNQLRFNINAVGSYYMPANFTATVNLTDDAANTEDTPYHEFGHHTMFRLQNNNFTEPYGENLFAHRWDEENTSRLAWVEGWANFIQAVLDAANYEEDGEYGFDENRNPLEQRAHYSWPNYWNITVGFRSEYYFACALYDLWDGASKGLPSTMPYRNYHGWNETDQLGNTWGTIDDVEFDFNTLCQPLIQNPSGDNKIKNPQDYVGYLVDIVNDCEKTADISRTMQENRVQWNVHEYEWGWNNSNFNTDDLGLNETYDENPSFPGSSYTDTYDVTIYNKNLTNTYSINQGSNNTHCITDNMFLGIWDSFSSVYKSTDLNLNTEYGGYNHRIFNTYGNNRINIINGSLELGSNETTAELNLGSESLLWNRGHGTLIINDGSTINVTEGASLFLAANSTTTIHGSGAINVQSGGYMCVEPGAVIHLEANNSYIVFNEGAQIGFNPDLEITPGSNCQMPWEIEYDGNGKVIFDCESYASFTHENEIIIGSPSEVWNNVDYKLKKDLLIYPGAELIIQNNSRIEFAENARLIIKPGGHLILDNSIVTSLSECGNHWQGIEVYGNSSEHQYTINDHCSQGKLTLVDATIENAISAVELWKPGDYSTTGGVVVANNTVFRNNGKSIHALMYNNFHPIDVERETDNLSTFHDCTFEITEAYMPDVTFYKHVDLNKVKGIRFYGCDFLMKDVEGTSDWNIGIASYSAGFQIYPRCVGPIPCTVYDDCTFRGFWSGIYGTDDIGNTFFVKQAVFTDNVHGVKVEGVNNFTVINSTFEVGHNPDKSSTCDAQDISAAGYGIYSNGSTGFAIEANEFTKYDGAPSGYYVGTYIANTEAVDVVYNNSYKNLSFANLAEGQCHIANETFEGLAYYCNTNESNYEDFKVDRYEEYGAIQTSIGSITHAAGNEFSGNAHFNFNNRGNHMIGYYYYDNFPDPVYNVAREQVAMQYANTCPDHYGGTGTNVILSSVEKQQIKAQYALDSASYLTVKATFESYTDGGDTDALLSAVETATPADRDALKSSLLNISPFLSFDALMEVVDRTDVFPDSTIFEILAANPDELRNYDLISYLGAKQNPLPSYLIDSLVQLSTTTTYKTELMNDISTYAQLKAVSRNDILRSLHNDTIANEEELIDWITKEEKVRNDQQYVAALIKDQQYNKALAVADSMVLKHGYDVIQIAEHEYYMDMLELQITLAKENRSIYSLNSTEHANVKNIADMSKGIAGIRAKAIMGLAYNDHYCNCINTDDTSGYKNAQVSLIENDPVESKLNISVEPNPASDWIAFNFELPEEVDKANIRIMDVSGKVIHTIQIEGEKDRKIWSTSHLKPGLYLFSCHVNGYHKSGKFMITK